MNQPHTPPLGTPASDAASLPVSEQTDAKTIFKRMQSQRRALRRGLPWFVFVLVLCMIGLGLVLTYLITLSSTDNTSYDQYFGWLLWLNAAVATALGLLILWLGWRLYSRWRRGRFGSRLMLKLAGVFFLVGFLPGVLLYSVSYQFVSRTIDQWFDAEVDQALASGLDLGVVTLDNASRELNANIRAATDGLTTINQDNVHLERLRQRLNASDVLVWTDAGRFVAGAGASRYTVNAQAPAAALMQRIRAEGVVTSIQGFDSTEEGETNTTQAQQATIQAWALIQPSVLRLQSTGYVLAVVQPLPADVANNALAVQNAYRQYKERGLSLNGLRNMYIGTLSLTLFLAIFGAVLLAVLLGMQLVNPLLLLAEGMRRVAAGDLTPLPRVAQRDELSGLTASFSAMTKQLADARHQTQDTLRALDGARAHLQIVQDSLSSGVLILDETGKLLSANPGAEQLLGVAVTQAYRQPLWILPALADLAQQIQRHFDKHAQTDNDTERAGNKPLWEQVFELPALAPPNSETPNPAPPTTQSATPHAAQQTRSVVAKGTFFWQPDAVGRLVRRQLVVLDDMTALVSAQRAQAWAEVARRLAHEIKNPLTPIQLSAERLEMKLEGKLDERDTTILHKSVRTIVEQVDALKVLVNEFREYARLPRAKLEELDINQLVLDVLQLYPKAYRKTNIACVLDAQQPRIQADAQQLRQVLHNVLQNAQYAAEKKWAGNHSDGNHLDRSDTNNSHADNANMTQQPLVTVRTQVDVAGQCLRLSVVDNGGGFPDNVLQRAFEPYVTTKPKGTGLGLPMVKKIADEHQAQLSVENVWVCVQHDTAAHPKYSHQVLAVAREKNHTTGKNKSENEERTQWEQNTATLPADCPPLAENTTSTALDTPPSDNPSNEHKGEHLEEKNAPCVRGAKVSLSFTLT